MPCGSPNSSSGFLYYVSVTGITGERTKLPPELLDNVSWLREQTPLPICIGFGISQPEHVKLLAPVADGLIVGSAIVRRIAEAGNKPRAEVLKDVGEYAAYAADVARWRMATERSGGLESARRLGEGIAHRRLVRLA